MIPVLMNVMTSMCDLWHDNYCILVLITPLYKVLFAFGLSHLKQDKHISYAAANI